MVKPMLKMVILHHIKHKPIGSNASPLIEELREGYPPAQLMKMTDSNSSGIKSPTGLLFQRVSGTG